MGKKEEIIGKERIYEGRKVDFYVVDVRMPSGKVVKRELVDHPGAAVILPLFDNGNVLLEEHYRFAVGGPLLEAPAGTLDPEEDPEEAARRELEEETGIRAGQMLLLGSFYSSPGVLNELMHAYLARGLARGERDLEDDETIELVEVPLSQAVEYALSGRIRDAKTIATLFLAVNFLQREQEATP